ncbi:MAG TPA: TIM-barrel domain-containing protein [Bacteroidales bacterium]
MNRKNIWLFIGLFFTLIAWDFPENDISIKTEYGFPVIHIENFNNPDIIIQPISHDFGSIGYEKEGNIIWLHGYPLIKKSGDGMVLVWNTVNDKVKMGIEFSKENTDLNFHISVLSNESALPTKWFINFKSIPDEYFTGVLERVVDGNQANSWQPGLSNTLNLRGEIVEVKLKPTLSAYAPFYLSSSNYGFFVKGTWPGVIDFCKSNSQFVQISFEGPDFNFKIYRANTPIKIVKKHALETGPLFVPPKWAFGPWRWRDEHINNKKYYDGTPVKAPYNSQIVEDILMMEAYGIPCTAYWIDRPWGPGVLGFDDYVFDTSRFPQPENMIKWLNKKDIEFAIWIGPFVMGDMAKIAAKNKFCLESDHSDFPLIDFTNSAACKWWGENGAAKLARMGVKGFKLDRADGETLTDSMHLKTSIGTSYRVNYNDYARQYVKATYNAVKPILGNDFVLFPRAQYTGSAKYGALWAGDIAGGEYGLRAAIIALQRCVIMGYPNWASDIGGYWGKFDRETCMRWLAFGCFSPMMEVGPTHNKGFWDSPDNPSYDPELIATWRLYSITRMKLMDYIHSLSIEAGKTGLPIVRPLFLAYPNQKPAWSDWQTYLLGPDILVSAIWENGANKHQLYLPANETWIDAWDTTKVFEGGQYVEIETPPYKIPVFIRKGASIHLGDLHVIYKESLKIAMSKPDLTKLELMEGWK